MKVQTINPATEQVLNTYEYLNDDQINYKVVDGHAAFMQWKNTSFKERKSLMIKLANQLLNSKDELATLMANEMGKPVYLGRGEIEKCAWVCQHFAEKAQEYLASREIATEMKKVKVVYQPLGLIFAIMPWNFPFWQVFRFAAPTIMAGNGAILKHAPICFGTGNRIEQLFSDAGFPKHLFQHLILNNDGAATLIAQEQIAGVTLTGSELAGQTVAAQAGKYTKKVVLELGGSDPYVILEDANLDWAAECIVKSRLNNNGQVCIAAKRIIVLESVMDELTQLILNKISAYSIGDPLNEETKIGPLARKDLREHLHLQVLKSIDQGAKLLLGGIIPPGTGFYYPPTVLMDVRPGVCAFDEELFGPVIAIIAAKDEKQAIAYANQGKYGLGAAVFTKNLARGERIATDEIETGTCFVNQMVASDPRVPFGGIKHSGFGRELSQEGILEFVNIKTIGIHDPENK